MQAFQGFLSQVRNFLSFCLPWIVVLDSRGMEQRLCRGDGQLSVSSEHTGIYHGAHHHSWPWAAAACQSSILASGTSQVAEAASADDVVSCWPRGLNCCWFFKGNQTLLTGSSQWVKWSQAHLPGIPYTCLSSILCRDSKENSVGALDRKLDPPRSGLSPRWAACWLILIAGWFPPALLSASPFSLGIFYPVSSRKTGSYINIHFFKAIV